MCTVQVRSSQRPRIQLARALKPRVVARSRASSRPGARRRPPPRPARRTRAAQVMASEQSSATSVHASSRLIRSRARAWSKLRRPRRCKRCPACHRAHSRIISSAAPRFTTYSLRRLLCRMRCRARCCFSTSSAAFSRSPPSSTLPQKEERRPVSRANGWRHPRSSSPSSRGATSAASAAALFAPGCVEADRGPRARPGQRVAEVAVAVSTAMAGGKDVWLRATPMGMRTRMAWWTETRSTATPTTSVETCRLRRRQGCAVGACAASAQSSKSSFLFASH